MDAIDNIQYRPGSTNTADSLKKVRTRMFTEANGDRPNAENVAILVTDGVSNINYRQTVTEAELLRQQGVHVYTVGIGITDTWELEHIASEPTSENSFFVNELQTLVSLDMKIISAICSGYTQSLKKTEFMTLLSDTPGITSSTRYRDVREDISQDPRFTNVDTESQREAYFDEYSQNLKKAGFLQLLQDTPDITASTSWTEAKALIDTDPRYHAVDSELLRAKWFDEYINNLAELG